MSECITAHRIDVLGSVVLNGDARSLAPNLAYILQLEILFKLQIYGFGMSADYRYARGGCRYAYRIVIQDFMRLVHHLHLLLRVTVLKEIVNVRNDVLVNRIREFCRIFAPLGAVPFGFHLCDSLVARSRNTLICRDYDSLYMIFLMKRCQRQQHLDCGAVRVGDDIVLFRQHVGVHLRHYKFLCRVHSPAG